MSSLILLPLIRCSSTTDIGKYLKILERSHGNEVVSECDLVALVNVGGTQPILEASSKGARGIFVISPDKTKEFEYASFPKSRCLVLTVYPFGNLSKIIDLGKTLQRYKPVSVLVLEYKQHQNFVLNYTEHDITFPTILDDTGEVNYRDRLKTCTWLREISSCSSLTALPGPAWVLLSKICILFSRSLYLSYLIPLRLASS